MVPRTRLTATAAAALALVVLGVTTFVGPAQSDAGRTGFSALEPPRAYLWGDCRIRVGPGYDAARAGRPDWRVVGGGQVDCSRRHARITIQVREVRASGGPLAVTVAAGARSVSGASTGFVRTGAACRDASAARWRTDVLVIVDGWSSGWVGGRWSAARTDGCGSR